MGEYQFDVIPLTEGLNFNTATSLATPGTLRDCLNYEFVDGAGLKRIDGMRLYDGNSRNKIDKLFFIRVVDVAVANDSVFGNNPWLYVENSDNPDKIPFGILVNRNSGDLPFDATAGSGPIIPFIRLECPSYADPSFSSGDVKLLNSSALTVTSGTYTIVTLGELTAAQETAVFGSDITAVGEEGDLLYGNKCNYVSLNNQFATGFVTDIPTDVVWAEKIDGKTFQIADAFVVNGEPLQQIYPGDYIYFNSTGMGNEYPLVVLKAELLAGGSWTGGSKATLHVAYLKTSSSAEQTFRPVSPQVVVGESASDAHLYRHTGGLLVDMLIGKWGDDLTIDYRSDIAVMYEVCDEKTAVTNDSVFAITAPVTEGTTYDLTEDTVTASSGDAEAMPLISGGAVKAIVPTKRGSGYTTAPSFAIEAPLGGGTAATTPVASQTKTINRTDWQFVHTGWNIPFREGDRKYGYFNKIDRYKDIDGNTYSASSSVTGLEASFLINQVSAVDAPAFSPFATIGNAITRWSNMGQWVTNSGATLTDGNLAVAIGAEDDAAYIKQTLTDNLAYNNAISTRVLTLGGFTGSTPLFDIAEGSSVKGLKLSVRMDSNGTTDIAGAAELHAFAVLGKAEINPNTGSYWVTKQYGQPVELMNSTTNLRDTFDNVTVNDVTFTAGGTDDLFGASSIPLEDLLDPGFCIGIFFTSNYATNSANLEIRVDHVYLDAYYELPSVRMYFKSNATSHAGGDAVTIHGDLVDYVVSKGSLEAGDAEGFLTVVNLRTTKADDSGGTGLATGNSTVPYYTILPDMDIYQDSGLTVKIGETSGEMTFNGFESYRTTKQADTRYTSVRANFFANDEYESFYICSGAGRAGIWDGKYWSRIFAINPRQENSATLDVPRHIGVHNFHLMLGYKSGSVLYSAPGEPSNFSAFDGAGEIGIGDKIHGFNRLQGNAFGVFCEESIHAITGTDAGNFATQILVPNEGALEHSVASFGSRVIYTSKTGITTLDQSEKYGNFLGRRLSFDVNPWLIPRITGGAGLFTKITDFNPVFEAGNGYVCAYAVPHKNQYRLIFKDGLQLWMTLVSDDAPKFTFVQYFVGGYSEESILALPVTPNYVSSVGSATDQNTIIFCPDREFIYAIERSDGFLYGAGDATSVFYSMPGIYSLDVGDSFESGFAGLALGQGRRGGSAIPHYALITYQYLKNPFTSKTLRKVRLEGQARGAAPLTIYCDDGYKTSAQDVRTIGTNISLPKTPLDELKLSFLPESTLASVAATGRVLSILLVGEALPKDAYFTTTGTESLTSTRTTVPTPAHYLQALLLQFSEQGTEDA